MAVGAAAACEVVFPFAMAAEAGIARGCRLLLVTAVAVHAVLMFVLDVQPGQRSELMAARARRWLGDPIGTVGSMTGEATVAQLAVGACGLLGMAAAAGVACQGAGVRFVAARAVLVPARRRLAF